MKGKIFGYVRVSTKEQNLDRQFIAMRQFGVPDGNIFVDRQSGKDFERPAYQKMMHTLREGDTIILKSLDRLGRSYREVLEQWRIITKEKKVHVYVIDTPVLDTRRSHDLVGTLISDIILAVFSCVAEMERTFNRQRQAEGIAAARQRGGRFGAVPKERTPEFYKLKEKWRRGEISARQAARQLLIDHKTFLRWVKEAPQGE